MVLIVALHVLPPLVFAVMHGARAYGRRGILAFVLLCILIGNAMENLGVATGFPYGRYHFTDVMGPKVFAVPILLGLAYIGMGYISWVVARAILGESAGRMTLPLAAAFVMVAWDLSMDPVWSNLVDAWRWHEGGAWFGVPVSNFFGWYLTVWLIYQSFALWVGPVTLGRGYLRVAVAFYAVCAIGNLFDVLAPHPEAITDASGALWRVSAILGESAIVSIFVMGALAVIAWVRLDDR